MKSVESAKYRIFLDGEFKLKKSSASRRLDKLRRETKREKKKSKKKERDEDEVKKETSGDECEIKIIGAPRRDDDSESTASTSAPQVCN